jgi:hypothetical protein
MLAPCHLWCRLDVTAGKPPVFPSNHDYGNEKIDIAKCSQAVARGLARSAVKPGVRHAFVPSSFASITIADLRPVPQVA